ncbi:MAG TPA: hypothetical protein VG125_33065 [Pirellulales bacterium]|nr:hypothetical protein [Pirellulales bacterium]
MSDRSDDLPLQPGEIVEVRHADEILGTLAADGTLDGLPFMPEMLPFCGQRFRVFRRAHKTCDTISWSGLRGMDRTVHLEDLRCDGSAHGGCQAGCLLFWKEAWLRRVDGNGPATQGPDSDQLAADRWLREHCRVASSEGDARFRCQATELLRATYPLPVLQPSQYVCDVRSNGATWRGAARGIGLSLINRCLRLLRQPTMPRVVGSLRRTPHVELGLAAGDRVEVKSHAEILATLDRRGKNRGLSFDSEMIPYCGGQFRVLRRVETIVDEATGKLRTLPGVCIVLEGVVCRGVYHRSCPRSIYPYWREIWLHRVE